MYHDDGHNACCFTEKHSQLAYKSGPFKWRFQGGQSCGQHDWVHGFLEPVKSIITFVILSQISCGKVQNPSQFFCTRLCQSFFWVCRSFPDNLEQLKKEWNILRDRVYTSVVRGYLENCSKPTVLCKNKNEFFFIALYRMKNESCERFSLLVMSDYCFVKSVNLIRQTT